jgi:hypothetical protein
MVLRERERVMYRRMSAALKPQLLSTSMVIAPNEHEEWTERTTKARYGESNYGAPRQEIQPHSHLTSDVHANTTGARI